MWGLYSRPRRFVVVEPRAVALYYGDDELREFARRYLRGSFLVMGVIALAIVLALAWSESRRDDATLDILRKPVAVVLLASFAVGALWHGAMTPRRIARGLLDTYGGRDVQVAWDEDAMTITAPRLTARQTWRDVRRVIETKRLLVLVVGQDVVIVLPKRDLGPHQAEVRALARDRGRA